MLSTGVFLTCATQILWSNGPETNQQIGSRDQIETKWLSRHAQRQYKGRRDGTESLRRMAAVPFLSLHRLIGADGMAVPEPHTIATVSEHGAVFASGDGGPMEVVAALPAAVMIAGGPGYNAVLSRAGEVYMQGTNTYGRLGIGAAWTTAHRFECHTAEVFVWTRVPQELFSGARVVQIALGEWHSVALGENGRVYTAGCNYGGRLGNGTEIYETLFGRVTALDHERMVFVAAGTNGTAALCSAGRVWVWGGNCEGQLGTGDLEIRVLPVRLPAFGTAPTVFISMDGHTAAVQTDDTVYTWGCNADSQLGLGDTTDRLQPVRVACKPAVKVVCGAVYTLLLTTDGVVYGCGGVARRRGRARRGRTSVFCRVEGLPRMRSMAWCGVEEACFVSIAGDCYTWDYNMHKYHTFYNKGRPPTLWPLATRAGLFHAIATDHQLAFAMLAHKRLGEQCPLNRLPSELVRRIFDVGVSWPSGPVGLDGLARLLGGGTR